jgi:alkaline phosphatase
MQPPRSSLWVLVCASLALLGAGRAAPARNAILFIGDGMGVPVLTAARIHGPGAAGRLEMELENAALVRTASLDRMVTDSAAGAVALLAGERVRSGTIGMSPGTRRTCSRVKRPDESPNPHFPCGPDARPIPSLADLALGAGMAVGVVTTTTVTHATPAAVYAHVDDREMEEEIAAQLVARSDLAFVAGGGRDFFAPFEMRGEAPAGRADGRDLLAELRAKGYAVAGTGEELRRAVGEGRERIAGLLAPGHLPFEIERRAKSPEEPSLAELTELAIRHLSRHPGGYFLVVEGGRIDHALHVNRAALALADTLALDQAVAAAKKLTSAADTLLVVTADHGHPLVIAGYPLVDDPILGLARAFDGIEAADEDKDGLPDYERALDGKAMTVLQFANGPGHGDSAAAEPHAAPREDPAKLAGGTSDPRYQQESAVPLQYSAHEGSDVMAAARGPGAERVRGFLDNTEIFAVLRDALGLGRPPAGAP